MHMSTPQTELLQALLGYMFTIHMSTATMETWVTDELSASFRKSTHIDELFLGVNVFTEENFSLICKDPETF